MFLILGLLIACEDDDTEKQDDDSGNDKNDETTLDYDEVFRPEVEEATVESWVQNLEIPWSLVFLSTDTALVAERPGRIRLIVNGELYNEPYLEIDEVVHQGEGGLMGLAVHPEFEENKYLYAMYTYEEDGELFNKVKRFIHQGGTAEIDEDVIAGIPGDHIHNGGRIDFGPDGKLYVCTGDANEENLAQYRDNLAGKLLRLNDDGSVPDDNPFDSPVYTYGHRNPQGIAWNPDDHELFQSEHGPVAHDKVNHIVGGQNYGWPEVDGLDESGEFANPVVLWPDRSVPPSGMTFHQGDIFLATLASEALVRIILDEEADQPTVRKIERWFAEDERNGDYGRLRDATEGPDGNLYFLSSNRDGRGSPQADDDQIYRVSY